MWASQNGATHRMSGFPLVSLKRNLRKKRLNPAATPSQNKKRRVPEARGTKSMKKCTMICMKNAIATCTRKQAKAGAVGGRHENPRPCGPTTASKRLEVLLVDSARAKPSRPVAPSIFQSPTAFSGTLPSWGRTTNRVRLGKMWRGSCLPKQSLLASPDLLIVKLRFWLGMGQSPAAQKN